LPAVVNAVFRWNNQGQAFEFWFRGFPASFNTLVDLDPGDFYFFQATGTGTVSVPNPSSYTVPPPGGSFTVGVTGATGRTWSGNAIAEATIESAIPSGVSAIFRWNDGGQSFEFWFRGFPAAFDTLDAGIEHGKYYFFQAATGTVVPMP
jgi:hypothetical protein